MRQIQWNSSAISRISIGKTPAVLGTISAFVIRTSFPRGQTFVEHLTLCVYVNIHCGFCGKMNLTVHANRPIFSFRPEGKCPTGPACYCVLSEHKHWLCIYTLPQLYCKPTFIPPLKAETVSKILEWRHWSVYLFESLKSYVRLTNFRHTHTVCERDLFDRASLI